MHHILGQRRGIHRVAAWGLTTREAQLGKRLQRKLHDRHAEL